jgi:hypothetical protein
LYLTQKVTRKIHNNPLDSLCGKVDETKKDVHKMINHLTMTVTGVIPGIALARIPLNPCQVDYELSNYWRQASWQAIQSRLRTKDPNLSILSLFVEDEFDKPVLDKVLDKVKEEVHMVLYSYWVNNTGEVLTCYKDLSFKRKEDFQKTIEGKYPWLRLCEGHWKVWQLWICPQITLSCSQIVLPCPQLAHPCPWIAF